MLYRNITIQYWVFTWIIVTYCWRQGSHYDHTDNQYHDSPSHSLSHNSTHLNIQRFLSTVRGVHCLVGSEICEDCGSSLWPDGLTDFNWAEADGMAREGKAEDFPPPDIQQTTPGWPESVLPVLISITGLTTLNDRTLSHAATWHFPNNFNQLRSFIRRTALLESMQ